MHTFMWKEISFDTVWSYKLLETAPMFNNEEWLKGTVIYSTGCYYDLFPQCRVSYYQVMLIKADPTSKDTEWHSKEEIPTEWKSVWQLPEWGPLSTVLSP